MKHVKVNARRWLTYFGVRHAAEEWVRVSKILYEAEKDYIHLFIV
jgi:hypothetical protein